MIDLHTFLGHMFSPEENQLIELRKRCSDGKWEILFVSTPEAVEQWVDANREKGDLYFGVGGRKHKTCPVGCKNDKGLPKTGDRHCVDLIHALYVDLDFYKKGISIHEAIQNILNFELKPSIIISSGQGLQAYWLLCPPYRSGMVYADLGELTFERILAGLIKAVDGDPNCKDLGRILRLPNSLNWKPRRERSQDPKPVTIVDFSGQTYRLENFVYLADASVAQPTPTTTFHCAQIQSTFDSVTRLKLRSALETDERVWKIWHGHTEHKSGSEKDMALMNALRRRGFNPSQIKACFINMPPPYPKAFARTNHYLDLSLSKVFTQGYGGYDV